LQLPVLKFEKHLYHEKINYTTISYIFFLSGIFTGNVKWYTIQEAEKLTRQDPRPLFIDTYTDWCGWCKKWTGKPLQIQLYQIF